MWIIEINMYLLDDAYIYAIKNDLFGWKIAVLKFAHHFVPIMLMHKTNITLIFYWKAVWKQWWLVSNHLHIMACIEPFTPTISSSTYWKAVWKQVQFHEVFVINLCLDLYFFAHEPSKRAGIGERRINVLGLKKDFQPTRMA